MFSALSRMTLPPIYGLDPLQLLDYASFVYDSATDSCKRTLDTVHHSSLRVVRVY